MTPPGAGPGPVDQATPPKPRRRWWLALSFVILASIVVCAVLVFAQPPPRPFRFLSQAKLVRDLEYTYSVGGHGITYVRTTNYRRAGSFKDFMIKIKAEIGEARFLQKGVLGFSTATFSLSAEDQMTVLDDGIETFVIFEQSRPATLIDRARVWLKHKFSSPPTSPEEDGLYQRE